MSEIEIFRTKEDADVFRSLPFRGKREKKSPPLKKIGAKGFGNGTYEKTWSKKTVASLSCSCRVVVVVVVVVIVVVAVVAVITVRCSN